MCKNGRIWRWVDHTVGHSTLIIISSDFREGNTSLLYTGLMATRALTLRVHLLGQNLKKDNIQKKIDIFFWGGPKFFFKRTVR